MVERKDGVVIHIAQNFSGVEPDRVARVFQDELAKTIRQHEVSETIFERVRYLRPRGLWKRIRYAARLVLEVMRK